jgi:predicted GTPase
MKKIAGRPKTD